MDSAENVLDAIGALCELTGFIFQQLMKNGFTREEAFQMAAEYFIGSLNGNKREDTDE